MCELKNTYLGLFSNDNKMSICVNDQAYCFIIVQLMLIRTVYIRGAKVGGGVATPPPPEFWVLKLGGVEPP